MKLLLPLVLCATGIPILATPRCSAAEPLVQVNASVEIYEFPPARAATWQKTFEESAEPDRQKLVAQLRVGTTEEVKTVGFGQRVCALNFPSTVATVEQYRYPTAFKTENGFATPSTFEVTNVGCTMTLKVTTTGAGQTFTVDTDIRDVALLSTQHYAAAKSDQPGSIEQPVFASQTVATRYLLFSGVPKLVSVYSPHQDDKAPKVLRLIFVTVRPDR